MVDRTNGTGVPNTSNDSVELKPIADAIKAAEKKVKAATNKVNAEAAEAAAVLEAAAAIAAPAVIGKAVEGAPDPFNIDDLVLTQSFAEAVGAEEVINTILIRKPNDQDWFRVHPHASFRKTFGIIEYKADKEIYFIHPQLMAALGQFAKPAILYTWVDSTPNPLPKLWPVRVPKENETDYPWWVTAREIAATAMENWVQMWSDKPNGIYRFRPAKKLADKKADFRGLTSARIFELAVNTRLIKTVDHPVAQQLLTGV